MPSDNDSIGDAEALIEEFIRIFGGLRRFEISEPQDEPFESDDPDEADCEVLDVRRPESLEELMTLLSSEFNALEQQRMNEDREKRMMTAFYVFGAAGIIASAATGNVLILAVILAYFLKVFRTLP